MKIYRAELVKRYIQLCPNSMAFSDIITLVFLHNRHLVLEQPIVVLPRTAGKSTISTKTAVKTVLELLNIVMMFSPMRSAVAAGRHALGPAYPAARRRRIRRNTCSC